jgi:hypothetical protein
MRNFFLLHQNIEMNLIDNDMEALTSLLDKELSKHRKKKSNFFLKRLVYVISIADGVA